MLYYPPGRVLLIIAGLLHIAFSMGTFAVSIIEISAISYSDIPLLSLPDSLSNISWIGHYLLALVIGMGNLVLGIMAIKHRQHSDKAKLLLMLSVAGLIVYTAFVFFSAYEEAYLRGNLFTLPFGFGVPIMFIIGAGMNFIAHLRHTKKA